MGIKGMFGPKYLKIFIIHEHHMAPTLEEIIHKSAGITTYSKLDVQMFLEHIPHT